MKIDQLLKEAQQHKEERDTYLYRNGRDEARKIQNESGRDMDVSNLDAGEPPKVLKTVTYNFTDGAKYEVEPDWSVLEALK